MTRERRGFTLLELLVSLAILGLALATLASLWTTGLRGGREAELRLEALQVARQRLASLGALVRLEPGRSEGVEGGFHWQIEQRLLDTGEGGVLPYAVTVTIAWRAHGGGTLAIEAVRLVTTAGPATASPEADLPGGWSW
jgi:prepilin-type N-terminal cleavage/methylation domain-containing protein